ncbi:MAG: hypothetical protein M0Z50_14240 [Planctomycetia bacterium]|nr:hypothetical protein [Planctomycetia bacterium]
MRKATIGILLAAGCSSVALAAPLSSVNLTQSVITDNAMNGVRGAIMTNMAAGSVNVQSNLATIIMSPNGQSVAQPVTQVQQSAHGNIIETSMNQHTAISGAAFGDANGIIAINQAAGVGNAEANNINMVIGASKPLSNDVLAQSLSSLPGTQPSSQSENSNTVVADATAFKGAGGIAQINQVSGSGNASANSFALGISPGVMR